MSSTATHAQLNVNPNEKHAHFSLSGMMKCWTVTFSIPIKTQTCTITVTFLCLIHNRNALNLIELSRPTAKNKCKFDHVVISIWYYFIILTII